MTDRREGFRPWELYVTCCNCGHPLDDNQRMKDALTVANASTWACINLRVIADMAEAKGLPEWFVSEVRRIYVGLLTLPSPNYIGDDKDNSLEQDEVL